MRVFGGAVTRFRDEIGIQGAKTSLVSTMPLSIHLGEVNSPSRDLSGC
jgi:hypothetical protein